MQKDIKSQVRTIRTIVINRPTNVYYLSNIYKKRLPLSPVELYSYAGEDYDEYEYPEEIIQYSLADIGYDPKKSKLAWFDTNIVPKPTRRFPKPDLEEPTVETKPSNANSKALKVVKSTPSNKK
ncbi:MAG: hypothetical protein ACRC4M_05895 [Mycoplasma sp.]